jgi:DNA-binding transcriptional ArsR family regulator
VTNINVPPKSTNTEGFRPPENEPRSTLAGVGRYKRSNDQGAQTRAALIRALSQRPGAQVRELCVLVGKSSTSTVQHHLNLLEAEGKIIRDDCPLCRGKIWRVA